MVCPASVCSEVAAAVGRRMLAEKRLWPPNLAVFVVFAVMMVSVASQPGNVGWERMQQGTSHASQGLTP